MQHLLAADDTADREVKPHRPSIRKSYKDEIKVV
jgi:hypothetical protein